MVTYFYILLTQIFYSASDILARKELAKTHSYWKTLKGLWIVPYLGLNLSGILINLYVYHVMLMGRAMIFKSCLALFLSAVVGSFYLHERIRFKQGLALFLILVAIIIQGTR